MVGRASGVCNAALWNSTIEPGFTFLSTRSEISLAVRFFQSRLSPMATASSGIFETKILDTLIQIDTKMYQLI